MSLQPLRRPHRPRQSRRTADAATVLTGTIAIALTVAACSSSKTHTSTTTSGAAKSSASSPTASSSAASSTDYTQLLITPSDIPLQGVTRQTAGTPPQGTGATALFVDPSGTRKLGDTIIVLPDASSAGTALHAAQQAAMSELTDAKSQASTVGSNGMVLSGTTSGGSTASTVLVFGEGRAYVVLQFDSAANDPVPPALVEQVGTKQDQLIKNGLPH